jgi:hypothetical protein
MAVPNRVSIAPLTLLAGNKPQPVDRESVAEILTQGAMAGC